MSTPKRRETLSARRRSARRTRWPSVTAKRPNAAASAGTSRETASVSSSPRGSRRPEEPLVLLLVEDGLDELDDARHGGLDFLGGAREVCFGAVVRVRDLGVRAIHGHARGV